MAKRRIWKSHGAQELHCEQLRNEIIAAVQLRHPHLTRDEAIDYIIQNYIAPKGGSNP